MAKWPKYVVTIGGKTYPPLPKKRAIYEIVRHLCDSGVTPQQIGKIIHWIPVTYLFKSVDGEVDSRTFDKIVKAQSRAKGRRLQKLRRFDADSDLIYSGGRTYALISQWSTDTQEAINLLIKTFPDAEISYRVIK